MIGITKLFIIIYAITNDLLPLEICRKNAYCSLLTKISTMCLSILFLLITYAILLPFALLRICIGIILKILHQKSYGGLLTGLDTLFEMFPNKTVINVINIYASKEDPTITNQKVKDIVYQIYCSSFKFSSNIQSFLGYCYYLKDQVNFEEVVDIIRYNSEEYMSKEMLFNYLEENCLTLKDNQMWKVVIFSQPISWSRSNKDEYKQYAIIWTLRHSLGDGPSIITIFQKHANEDGFKMDTTKFEQLRKKMNSKITLDNVSLRRNPVTTKLDGLALKIPENTKWFAVSFMETRPKYVAVIKKIKDELNVNFTEVVSAAIIASVHDYIKQRKVTLDNFTIAKVIRLKSEDLLKLRKGAYKFEEIKNNFGFIAFQLPTNLEGRNVKNIIQYLQQYNESLRNAVDPLVASTVLDQICTYLPINLSRASCTSFMDSMTIGVTNLVGFKKSTLCGNTIDDVFFFTPGVLNTAFTFSIFSYDDRLQIILTSREGFVHNREDLQSMLDNVFMYINRVQEEILLTN